MDHSHGYEMRLQTARKLRIEEAAKKRKTAMERAWRRERLDALARVLNAIEGLPEVLAKYEATGDHDHTLHGTRPILPGAPCPGGDCLVDKARKVIAALGLTNKANLT